MSRIDKMMITGIRSFGPERGQTIKFEPPLTLIVGWNGSGKTTIIECLRYATTGDLPPNSKTGGAFLHDPKLANEKDLLAQVKLSFHSTSGVRMVATRSMQVSVKKNSRSQKSLDGSLLMLKNNEKHSISTRVAEFDQLIPQYLGVPKAILDNVIFCHQEDSLWPLTDASALKKKFDEIFEAMKYAKAVDNIKMIRKNQNIALGQLKIIEDHCKEDKSRAAQSRTRQEKLFKEIEQLREDYEVIDQEVTEAQKKAREAYDHSVRFSQIVNDLEFKRTTYEANKHSVAELEDNLTHMAESDSELQSMLDQYAQRVATYATQNDEHRHKYANLKDALEDVRESLGVKRSEIGKHEAQKEQYDRQIVQRETLIKEAAKRHGIRGYDYDVTDKQAADFKQILSKMFRDQNKVLERARDESQRELKEAQEKLNQLNTRKSAAFQAKDSARALVSSNDKRMSDLQKAMNQINADEGSEVILEDKKRGIEEQLQTAISAASSERYEERLHEATHNERSLENQRERLTKELGEATKQAKESASIDYARNELQSAQHSLETMKKVHSERISELVEPDWDPSTLETAFQQALSEKVSNLREASSRRDISQSKLDKINFQHSSLEAQLKKKRSELRQYEQIVTEAIQKDDISEFDETLQQLEDDYEGVSSDNAKFSANAEYMRSCLETARRHNVCRLCQRELHDDRSQKFTIEGFYTKLQDIITKAESNMKLDNPEELLAELEMARNAKPSYELALRLRDTEIPNLQAELTKLTSEREKVNKQLEDQDNIVHDLETARQEVESMSKEVQIIVGYYNKVHELEVQIKDLAQKQKAAGLSRGIDAVQSDLKKVTEDGRHARDALEQLVTARDKSRNLITSLELAVRDVNAELNGAQSKLKEKRELAGRIEELKAENNKQRECIRELDKEIEELAPDIEQAQYKYDDMNRRGNERVQRAHDDVSKLSDTLRLLNLAEEEIAAYIARGGPEQLTRTHREIENLQGDLARIESEMLHVMRKIKKIEDSVRDTEMTKRSIGDNLRYRKAKRSLEILETEIQKLEAHGAERDREQYTREAKHWDDQYHYLNTSKTSIERDMKNKDDQLTELMKEWDDIYATADEQYTKAHLKVETTKAAMEDLSRYAAALDKAIMQYHTLKMEEINRIIAELWTNAYQGTDVDSIRIASESEGKGNRLYNYRVVMCKQDTEMDMRGRCSAGQKVLACLVIRLALAECFGTNCGLIALDEPTTNLDQQNIKGLAESLSQIIQMRRKQRNFQLVVITHDEAFLSAMNCAEFTDVYWRVSRNAKQESQIERQDIADVS
ncbi:DNA repair protein rad50 [Pleosporales sp. CAS-2024a]